MHEGAQKCSGVGTHNMSDTKAACEVMACLPYYKYKRVTSLWLSHEHSNDLVTNKGRLWGQRQLSGQPYSTYLAWHLMRLKRLPAARKKRALTLALEMIDAQYVFHMPRSKLCIPSGENIR